MLLFWVKKQLLKSKFLGELFMNKKKKSKPRTMKSSDGEVAKQKIFNYYIKEMEENEYAHY